MTTSPSPPNSSRWRLRLVLVAVAAVVLPAGATVLYNFSPEESRFYPGCMFHALTGWHCPGCGATRCCYALVHGNLAQALAWNPLFVVALPLIAAGLVQSAYGRWTGRRVPLPRLPPWSIYLILCIIVSYWVLRNIDAYPLTLLAPHRLEQAPAGTP